MIWLAHLGAAAALTAVFVLCLGFSELGRFVHIRIRKPEPNRCAVVPSRK